MEGSSITSPPLVLKDMVITGMTGGEYATRGHLDAYDAATGKRKWRFYTIPAPGEPGNDTWKGESWKTGGRSDLADRQLRSRTQPRVLGGRESAPEFDRVARGEMDNLYSNSVVALDADTGTLKWHYQFTPDDGHDWDSVQDMVLVDRVWRGEPRKLLMHADRNGHFYVLDRTNGKFLSGTPFIYQNWNSGFTPNGRPQPVPGSNSTEKGSFPRLSDAWWRDEFPGAFLQSGHGLVLSRLRRRRAGVHQRSQEITRGQQYLGRGRAAGHHLARGPNQPATNAGIKAIDPETGKTVWSYPIFQGLADQRRARDRRQRRLRVIPRRQHPRARWQDRQIPLAFPDGRQPSSLADELRRRR
jgi:alcohol dehydrogenase (cytochrome c)